MLAFWMLHRRGATSAFFSPWRASARRWCPQAQQSVLRRRPNRGFSPYRSGGGPRSPRSGQAGAPARPVGPRIARRASQALRYRCGMHVTKAAQQECVRCAAGARLLLSSRDGVRSARLGSTREGPALCRFAPSGASASHSAGRRRRFLVDVARRHARCRSAAFGFVARRVVLVIVGVRGRRADGAPAPRAVGPD